MKKDISNLQDIKQLVNVFYQRIRDNSLLGPIFDEKIQNRWPEHLNKMYSFWQSILLDDNTYSGKPFPPHAQLAVSKEHFDTWLEIFTHTLDDLFEGPKADEAKWRSSQIAKMFLNKIEYLRNHNGKSLL